MDTARAGVLVRLPDRDSYLEGLQQELQQILSTIPYVPERYISSRLLWYKVIIRAAYDYVLYKDSSDIKQKRLYFSAEQWLFGKNQLGQINTDISFNSLETVCHALDCDPDLCRKIAKSLTREQVKKMEFLERSGKDLHQPIVAELLGSGDEDEEDPDGDD